MILLILFNWLFSVADQILLSVFNNAIPSLNSLTTWVTNVSVPQTFFDILSVTMYFLPMATIQALFWITAGIIGIRIIAAIVHVISLGKLL